MVAFVKRPFAVRETAFLFLRNRLLHPRVATFAASRGAAQRVASPFLLSYFRTFSFISLSYHKIFVSLLPKYKQA